MKRTITIISFLFLSFILGAQVKYDAKIFEDERMLNKQFGIDYYSGKTSVKGHSATFVVDDKQNAGFILVCNKKTHMVLGQNPRIKSQKRLFKIAIFQTYPWI